VRRSGKFAKVRDADPDTLGVRFGNLVRAYMIRRGLGNQDVARLVYRDEERKSSVSDVVNGRADNPTPDTVARYREALEIPHEEIEQILVSPSQYAHLEKIQADISSLAIDRQADRRTTTTTRVARFSPK